MQICGGGPRLAIWHLRSVKPMSVLEFEVENFVPNVCRIYDNQVSTQIRCSYLFFCVCEQLNIFLFYFVDTCLV